MSRTAFPSAEDGTILHQRLCAGDLTAPADVCAAYLDPLLAWLARVAAHTEADLRESAAHDALVDYVKHPGRYNPACADLGTYLRLAARRDLYNHRRREARHRQRRISWDCVEQGTEAGNYGGKEAEALARLTDEEERRRQQRCVQRVRDRCSAKEQAVLDLMMALEHRTEAYALVLDVTDRPRQEQEREVKRVKDRLMMRLKREGRS
jgi:RNA polymerase sigma-70 factor (ECF subfamily)